MLVTIGMDNKSLCVMFEPMGEKEDCDILMEAVKKAYQLGIMFDYYQLNRYQKQIIMRFFAGTEEKITSLQQFYNEKAEKLKNSRGN